MHCEKCFNARHGLLFHIPPVWLTCDQRMLGNWIDPLASAIPLMAGRRDPCPVAAGVHPIDARPETKLTHAGAIGRDAIKLGMTVHAGSNSTYVPS